MAEGSTHISLRYVNHLTQTLEAFRSLTAVRDVSMIGSIFSSCQSSREDLSPSIQTVFESTDESLTISNPSPSQCVHSIQALLPSDSLSLSQVCMVDTLSPIGGMGSLGSTNSESYCILCLFRICTSVTHTSSFHSFSDGFTLPSFLLLSVGVSATNRTPFS